MRQKSLQVKRSFRYPAHGMTQKRNYVDNKTVVGRARSFNGKKQMSSGNLLGGGGEEELGEGWRCWEGVVAMGVTWEAG